MEAQLLECICICKDLGKERYVISHVRDYVEEVGILCEVKVVETIIMLQLILMIRLISFISIIKLALLKFLNMIITDTPESRLVVL